MEDVRRLDEIDNGKGCVRIEPLGNDDKRDRQDVTGKLKMTHKGSSGTKNET